VEVVIKTKKPTAEVESGFAIFFVKNKFKCIFFLRVIAQSVTLATIVP